MFTSVWDQTAWIFVKIGFVCRGGVQGLSDHLVFPYMHNHASHGVAPNHAPRAPSPQSFLISSWLGFPVSTSSSSVPTF